MGDLPGIINDYTIYDKSFNFTESGGVKASKVVLFCLDQETKELVLKERYISKMTKTDHELLEIQQQSMISKGEQRLLKKSMAEILLEIKKDEEQKNRIGRTGMEIESKLPSVRKSGSTLLNRHTPGRFLDLLGDDQNNRYLLRWLKSWEASVFKSKKYRFERRTAEMNKFFGMRQEKVNKFTKMDSTNKYKGKKFMSNKYKTQLMMENLQLDIKEDCEKLRNMIPLITGPPGCGKTSLARVVAQHCGYNPVLVSILLSDSLDQPLYC